MGTSPRLHRRLRKASDISAFSTTASSPLKRIDNDSEETSVGSLDVQVEHRQHHHLKELVVVGFDGMGWQTGFVKQIMIASPRLRRVHLLDGHVVEDEEREFGDLVIVPRQREWHECERSEVLEELAEGISMAHLEIVLE